MKFAIVILAAVAAASAQLQTYNPFSVFQKTYQPTYKPFDPKPFSRFTTPSPYRPFVSTTPAPIRYVPSTIAPTLAPVSVIAKVYNPDARNAAIVKYGNEANPDGSYNYFYETENGIAAQEQGTPRNFGGNPPVVPDVAQGSFSYTSPEGIPIVLSYIADENGFQPSGNHLPIGPPVPPLIARALEYIARSAPKK